MKKKNILVTLLLSGLAFSLAACANGGNNSSNTGEAGTSNGEPAISESLPASSGNESSNNDDVIKINKVDAGVFEGGFIAYKVVDSKINSLFVFSGDAAIFLNGIYQQDKLIGFSGPLGNILFADPSSGVVYYEIFGEYNFTYTNDELIFTNEADLSLKIDKDFNLNVETEYDENYEISYKDNEFDLSKESGDNKLTIKFNNDWTKCILTSNASYELKYEIEYKDNILTNSVSYTYNGKVMYEDNSIVKKESYGYSSTGSEYSYLYKVDGSSYEKICYKSYNEENYYQSYSKYSFDENRRLASKIYGYYVNDEEDKLSYNTKYDYSWNNNEKTTITSSYCYYCKDWDIAAKNIITYDDNNEVIKEIDYSYNMYSEEFNSTNEMEKTITDTGYVMVSKDDYDRETKTYNTITRETYSRVDNISTLLYEELKDGEFVMTKKRIRTLNESNWVTRDEWNFPDSSKNYYNEYELDEAGHRTLDIKYKMYGETYIPYIKYENKYNESGYPTYYLYSAYNQTKGEFYPCTKYEKEYNANNKETLYIEYKIVSNEAVPSRRTTTTYLNDELMTSKTVEVLTDGNWVPYSKNEYTYDSNGNKIKIINYSNYKDNDYLNVSYYIYEYDSNGEKIYCEEYYTTGTDHVKTGTTKYEVKINGNQSIKTNYVWDSTDGKWEYYTRYSYQETANISIEINEVYNKEKVLWITEYNTTKTYNSNGDIASIVYKSLVGVKLIVTKSETYKYNEKNQMIEYVNSAYFSDTNDIRPVEKYEYTYTASGLEETQKYYCLSVSGELELNAGHSYKYNDEGQVEESCTYANLDGVYTLVYREIEKCDEYGQKLLTSTEEYNDELKALILINKEVYTYLHGRVLTSERYETLAGQTTPVCVDKYIYTYNSKYQQTSYVHYEYNDTENELLPYEKHINEYDKYGNCILSEHYEYDTVKKAYLAVTKYTYEYDLNGDLITEYEYTTNTDKTGFEYYKKTVYDADRTATIYYYVDGYWVEG